MRTRSSSTKSSSGRGGRVADDPPDDFHGVFPGWYYHHHDSKEVLFRSMLRLVNLQLHKRVDLIPRMLYLNDMVDDHGHNNHKKSDGNNRSQHDDFEGANRHREYHQQPNNNTNNSSDELDPAGGTTTTEKTGEGEHFPSLSTATSVWLLPSLESLDTVTFLNDLVLPSCLHDLQQPPPSPPTPPQSRQKDQRRGGGGGGGGVGPKNNNNNNDPNNINGSTADDADEERRQHMYEKLSFCITLLKHLGMLVRQATAMTNDSAHFHDDGHDHDNDQHCKKDHDDHDEHMEDAETATDDDGNTRGASHDTTAVSWEQVQVWLEYQFLRQQEESSATKTHPSGQEQHQQHLHPSHHGYLLHPQSRPAPNYTHPSQLAHDVNHFCSLIQNVGEELLESALDTVAMVQQEQQQQGNQGGGADSSVHHDPQSTENNRGAIPFPMELHPGGESHHHHLSLSDAIQSTSLALAMMQTLHESLGFPVIRGGRSHDSSSSSPAILLLSSSGSFSMHLDSLLLQLWTSFATLLTIAYLPLLSSPPTRTHHPSIMTPPVFFHPYYHPGRAAMMDDYDGGPDGGYYDGCYEEENGGRGRRGGGEDATTTTTNNDHDAAATKTAGVHLVMDMTIFQLRQQKARCPLDPAMEPALVHTLILAVSTIIHMTKTAGGVAATPAIPPSFPPNDGSMTTAVPRPPDDEQYKEEESTAGLLLVLLRQLSQPILSMELIKTLHVVVLMMVQSSSSSSALLPSSHEECDCHQHERTHAVVLRAMADLLLLQNDQPTNGHRRGRSSRRRGPRGRRRDRDRDRPRRGRQNPWNSLLSTKLMMTTTTTTMTDAFVSTG